MPTIDRLSVLGAGKMGAALLTAMLDAEIVEPSNVVATALHTSRLDVIRDRFGVATELDNRAAVRSDADVGTHVVLLCVKPQVAPEVLETISADLGSHHVVLSIVAGLDTARIERHLDHRAISVVRAMPNTPSRIGYGMTAVCGGSHATAEHTELSREIFSRLGRALVLDEKHFDAVTGLSASGPAFLYIVIEALAEGGVKVGLPRKVATELAAQTCLGAGHMVVETGDHPALLKDEVTTPAGCTVDGILALETGGLRVTLINAVMEAVRRAGELVED